MNRLLAILTLMLALDVKPASYTLTAPPTSTDVSSAIPFSSGEQVFRYQQWFAGGMFGTNKLTVTNIVLVLQNPVTNTLQFSNLVVTVAESTNAAFTTNLWFNLTNSVKQTVVLATNGYTLNLTNANFSLAVTNLSYAFQAATSITNALQTNLLLDVAMVLTNGCSLVSLSPTPGFGLMNSCYRAFSVGGTNTAAWTDVEVIPATIGFTIP